MLWAHQMKTNSHTVQPEVSVSLALLVPLPPLRALMHGTWYQSHTDKGFIQDFPLRKGGQGVGRGGQGVGGGETGGGEGGQGVGRGGGETGGGEGGQGMGDGGGG